jgi:hypothetical protein
MYPFPEADNIRLDLEHALPFELDDSVPLGASARSGNNELGQKSSDANFMGSSCLYLLKI